MNNVKCFECEEPADINHHVIPKSKGGTKTIPLCNKCHSLVHDAKLISSSELIKNGRVIAGELKNRQKVVELFSKGMEKTKIAKKLKISRVTVYNILEEYGLYVNEGKGNEFKITPEFLDNIKEMRESGSTWRDIEEKLNICHSHLYRVIKEFGWHDGKYAGSSKNRESYRTLSPEKIEQAKKLRMENKTWEQIAHEIGVDRTTLYKHGLPQQFKPLKGQYTKEKKIIAKKLREEGRTWKEIAAFLEVSLSSIYMNGTHKNEN